MHATRIFKHQQRPFQVIVKDGAIERGVDIILTPTQPGADLEVTSVYTFTQASTANTKGYREIDSNGRAGKKTRDEAVDAFHLAIRNLFSALVAVV